MSVTVMNRTDALLYCYFPHDKPSILISISNPGTIYQDKPFMTKDNQILDILPLSFADADRPGLDVYGKPANYENMMSDKDGIKIAEFIKKYPSINIIVHCDAGISRSSGVAAGILKYLTGDDSAIFDHPMFHPNMWCYRKTLNALYS